MEYSTSTKEFFDRESRNDLDEFKKALDLVNSENALSQLITTWRLKIQIKTKYYGSINDTVLNIFMDFMYDGDDYRYARTFDTSTVKKINDQKKYKVVDRDDSLCEGGVCKIDLESLD